MIYLDSDTDSILPYGLKGTPFETVFKALQAVASTVWPVDAAELRAAIGWGWYLDNNLEELILLAAGKQYIQNILISEQVPLIKSTQTQEELVDLLYRWKNYKPTFDKLEDLYIPYAARVDIRPITDEATQEILPVTDIYNAFYVVLTDIDWSRPLTLGEAALIAERATPMGSHPIAVFQFEETINVYPQLAYGDVNFYTGTLEPAAEPTPPPPPPPEPSYSYIVFDTTTGTIVHSIVDEGLVYGEVGYVLMDEAAQMITVYETGVRTESFYFTTNGRNETGNTDISHSDIPVYNEDGTAPAADTLYNGSSVLAFVDVEGNTKQADGESLYVDDGTLRLDAPDTDEGEQWAALVESKAEINIECNFGDTITVPSGYRVKSVKSTDAFAFGHGTDSGSTVTVEYYGENTYSSDISQTDINTTGTPGMYMFQMNRNEFPIWGFKLIPNATVTSLSNISVNQNGDFVKLSGTSSYANTIATNANSYPGLFKYLNSSGTVVPQFFNVPSSLWKFESGTFSWLGNTSSPADLAYWYYNDAPYAGIVVTLTNEPEPEPPAPPLDYNLKVYGQNGDTISLSIENNFVYVFDEPNNRYIMLSGGTSSTIWEIVRIIDTNGNEVSKESDYIWWINGSNIYYKASPTRSVTAAYILLKVTPPIS